MVKSEPKIYSPSTSPVVASSPEDPSSSVNKMTKKKFKGVRMRSWGSWVSEIRAPNQKTRIWLGSYSTPEAAARAYDAALLCIKGSLAGPSLNFPISTASYYGIPQDGNSLMSPKSIQRVAAAAAATSCNAMRGASATPAFSPPPPLSFYPLCDESFSPMSHCSPSDHHEDEVSVYHANDHYDHIWEGQVSEPMANIDAWCNFDSPKYVDLMLNGEAFDTAAATNFLPDDFFDEQGDIRLWSFC